MNDQQPTQGFFLTDADRRDPLLKGVLTAGDLFGDMLRAPVDTNGKPVPQPDASRHPTKGVCRSCKRPMARLYIAFCGGWTALRECDRCYTSAVYATQPQPRKAEVRERTEQAQPWDEEEAA